MAAERALDILHPSLPSWSRDGRQIAFMVETAFTVPKKGADEHVWMAAADGSGAEKLVTGRMPLHSPVDGTLAYLSDADRPKIQTLYLRDADGNARHCAGIAGSIEAYRWSSDGTSLLALAADPGSDRAGSDSATTVGGEQANDDPKVEKPAEHWRRIWRVDAATLEATVVSPDGLNIWEFDGEGDELVALVSEDPSENGWYDARIVRIRGAAVETLHTPELQAGVIAVDPGTGAVAFVEALASDRGFLYGPVTVLGRDGSSRTHTLPFDVASLAWHPSGDIVCSGIARQDAAVGVLAPDGTLRHGRWPANVGGGAQLPAFAVSPDGQSVAAGYSSWTELPELRVISIAGELTDWAAVSALNAEIELDPGTCEVVSWAAPDGLEIEGLLMLPPGAAGPLPLLVNVHGGPTGAHHWHAPRHREQWAVDAGYAVFLPNPRGSVGRGAEFMQMNLGDMGGGDLGDVLAGVDALVDRGVADTDRVGVLGVSYGGFMAAWAVTQTNRFKASMAGAACINWVSFHNTSNIAKFDENFLQADPYDPAGDYVRRSPIWHVRDVQTPVLVIHGELDLCVPLAQGREFYQALVGEGIETELVIYPREGHGWSEREHQIDSATRMREWFDRHLRA